MTWNFSPLIYVNPHWGQKVDFLLMKRIGFGRSSKSHQKWIFWTNHLEGLPNQNMIQVAKNFYDWVSWSFSSIGAVKKSNIASCNIRKPKNSKIMTATSSSMPPEDQEARRKVQHCVSLVTFENLHAKLKEIVDNLTLQLHKLWNKLPLTKDQPWSWKSYP